MIGVPKRGQDSSQRTAIKTNRPHPTLVLTPGASPGSQVFMDVNTGEQPTQWQWLDVGGLFLIGPNWLLNIYFTWFLRFYFILFMFLI